MEPEPAKATVEHENETKPELINNNKDDDINKQPLEKNTPPRLSSSSSSASSSLSLEFAADENDLSSGPDDPWSMLSTSEPEPSTDGYDPNRIPASIFSTTTTTDASNWSLASNESLFSIHMGNNNSFSRDHAILCEKSGELGRVDDWNNENELMPVSTGGLATVIEETSGGASRVESFNKGPHLAFSKSLSMPRPSDASGNSCASFAFPVLVGDGVKTAGSSRKDVTEQRRRSEEEVCNTPPPAQQGPGEQGGGYWYSRLSCCCCCCWPRCC